MNRTEILQRISKERAEKMELARKLENYEGGCSHQFESVTNDIINQIVTKNDNIVYLNSLLEREEREPLTPIQVLLIIVFVFAIIALAFSR